MVCLVLTSLTIVAAVVERLADDVDDDDLSVVHEILAALVTTSVGYTPSM